MNNFRCCEGCGGVVVGCGENRGITRNGVRMGQRERTGGIDLKKPLKKLKLIKFLKLKKLLNTRNKKENI